ncbi:MAG: hypothetical protein BJ554DRAFT_7862, partial [Olpidium bornovanus]
MFPHPELLQLDKAIVEEARKQLKVSKVRMGEFLDGVAATTWGARYFWRISSYGGEGWNLILHPATASKSQARRCAELYFLKHLNPSDAKQYRRYRIFVKERLYRSNELGLAPLPRAERWQKLKEAYREVENEHAAYLRSLKLKPGRESRWSPVWPGQILSSQGKPLVAYTPLPPPQKRWRPTTQNDAWGRKITIVHPLDVRSETIAAQAFHGDPGAEFRLGAVMPSRFRRALQSALKLTDRPNSKTKSEKLFYFGCFSGFPRSPRPAPFPASGRPARASKTAAAAVANSPPPPEEKKKKAKIWAPRFFGVFVRPFVGNLQALGGAAARFATGATAAARLGRFPSFRAPSAAAPGHAPEVHVEPSSSAAAAAAETAVPGPPLPAPRPAPAAALPLLLLQPLRPGQLAGRGPELLAVAKLGHAHGPGGFLRRPHGGPGGRFAGGSAFCRQLPLLLDPPPLGPRKARQRGALRALCFFFFFCNVQTEFGLPLPAGGGGGGGLGGTAASRLLALGPHHAVVVKPRGFRAAGFVTPG